MIKCSQYACVNNTGIQRGKIHYSEYPEGHCVLSNPGITQFDERVWGCSTEFYGNETNTLHVLKTWPEYYKDVVEGIKTFEVRKNDRNFKVGDYLRLEEYDLQSGYTGKCIMAKVTYILDKEPFVPSGYVIMGIKV